MTSHRKTLIGAAVTATTRALTGTITIPQNQGGVLKAVEAVTVLPVFTTGQTTGGLVELENDSVDWKPFGFYTNSNVNLTSTSTGGSQIQPFRMNCNKKLPGGSIVTVYYTPAAAGSQKLGVTLCWEIGKFAGLQTYASWNLATAVTSTSKSSPHNSITIPYEKGGTVKAFMWKVHGTLTTIDTPGGLLQFFAPGADPAWEPLDFVTGGASCIGAGSILIEVEVKPVDLNLPGGVTVTTDYTPQSTQSQCIGLVIVWEGK